MTEERQAITVRLPVTLYEWVRKEAFERRVSQQSIIESAVDLYRHTPEWSKAEAGR